jgi:hypothetical protein
MPQTCVRISGLRLYIVLFRDCFSYKLYHQLVCYSPLLLLCLWRQRLCNLQLPDKLSMKLILLVLLLILLQFSIHSSKKNSRYICSKYSY